MHPAEVNTSPTPVVAGAKREAPLVEESICVDADLRIAPPTDRGRGVHGRRSWYSGEGGDAADPGGGNGAFVKGSRDRGVIAPDKNALPRRFEFRHDMSPRPSVRFGRGISLDKTDLRGFLPFAVYDQTQSAYQANAHCVLKVRTFENVAR